MAGSIFSYSTGNIQRLNITDTEMVKEISLNTSLTLGKPAYLSKDFRPLLGRGILSSSGPIWAHQRKTIAPELYMEKVKVYLWQSALFLLCTFQTYTSSIHNRINMFFISVYFC